MLLADTPTSSGIDRSPDPTGHAATLVSSRQLGSARAVWAVALTGLPKIFSRFCLEPAKCGLGDIATAIDGNGGPGPSIYAKRGLLYLWFRGSTRPILVIDRAGRVVRTVAAPGGVNSLAVDTDGNIYVTPPVDWFVERIDKRGHTKLIAGRQGTISELRGHCSLACGSGAGIPALKALFVGINGIDVDSRGRVLIADGGHLRVRRLDRDGIVRTVAGNGRTYGSYVKPPCLPPCHLQSGQPALKILLEAPGVVKAAQDGSFWFTEGSPSNNNLRVLWRVDLGGIAHLVDPGFFLSHAMSPITGHAVAISIDRHTRRPRLVDISLKGRRRLLLDSPGKNCASTLVALTCGDGFASPRASMNGVANYSLSAVAIDEAGGVYVASQGEEVRYLPPANDPQARLGFAITSNPIETPATKPIAIAYRASEPVTISARIEPINAGDPQPITIVAKTASSGTVTWDQTLAGTQATAGAYLLELRATDSKKRTSSRIIPITITSG